MKRAFMSELAIARSLIPSIAGVGLFIFVVLTLANASDGDSGMSAGACAVSAMSPIICSFDLDTWRRCAYPLACLPCSGALPWPR